MKVRIYKAGGSTGKFISKLDKFLPTAAAGINIKVVNTTSVTIVVYPNTSDVIDGGTVNAGVNLAPYSSVELVAQDTQDWYRVTNLIVYDTSGNRLN